MSTDPQMTRAERRTATHGDRMEALRQERSARKHSDDRDDRRRRILLFGGIVTIVLVAGVYLAAGDMFGQRGTANGSAAIPVRLSMAGFTPSEIKVPAGQTVALELWTTDAAPHLQGGVHTMISDELGINATLPAAGMTGESRRVVTINTPTTPGTYDIYCNSCCGGKESPTMHGKLTVEA